MSGLVGKQFIGEYKNAGIYTDFGDLFRFKGSRGTRVRQERYIGKFLLALGLMVLLFPLVLLLLNGEFNLVDIISPREVVFLLPYFCIPLFLYAGFLHRNRDVFDFNYERVNLRKSKGLIQSAKVKSLEIENFFDLEMLEAIDKFYFKYPGQFLLALSDFILSRPANVSILEKRLGVAVSGLREEVLTQFSKNQVDTSFEKNFQNLFFKSFEMGLYFGSRKIDPKIFLFVFIDGYYRELLKRLEITDFDIQGLKDWFKNENIKREYFSLWKNLSKLKPRGAVNRAYTSRATPTVDRFSQDFTSIAANGKFALSLGKEEAMQNILNLLQLSNGSAILLVGEPGVGKTHFLSHLATKMVVEDVPKSLQDYRMVVVDLNRVFTENSSIEGFKSVLLKMFEEISLSGNILLVFEEFSQVLGIREEGRLEVINLIINMINKYGTKVIATATTDDYARKIKAYKPLASLFEVVRLVEPTSNISLQILIDEIPRLESKYKLNIHIGAVKRIVEMSAKFDHERVMPDKGVNLLEEACISAASKNIGNISVDFVDGFISQKIGVSVGKISEDEAELLGNIEEEMHRKIIGQDEAIKAVAAALRRARAGVVSGKRPLASFLFFGPTGVGKTEVSKVLAQTYYGDEKLMIRLDMSEYQEESNLGRLIGYTDQGGNFLGGYLTDEIRTKPFSLVLLDEIEKANPKVLDLFLQVLDEGFMTDGAGRRVDFSNTIIIATSNAASREIADLILKGSKYYDVEKQVLPILREVFRVEFLNRFDRVIMFRPLLKHEVEQIAGLMLVKVNKGLIDRGMEMKWDKKTLEELADRGYNSIYGAREMRRVVQEEIEDKLANMIIEKKLVSGGKVNFSGLQIGQIV